MNVKFRQMIERRIIRRIVTDAIEAGYSVSVHDGEETTVKRSTDRKVIMAAIMSTDEDFLIISEGTQAHGWVSLIYGNDGWDVISDYTTNLEALLTPAIKVADRMEELFA